MMPELTKGFLRTSRASSAPGPAADHVKNGTTRRRALYAAIVIAVIVVGGAGYVLIADSGWGSSARPNRFANGAFEAGDLQGWQAVPPYLPTVESSNVAKGPPTQRASRRLPTTPTSRARASRSGRAAAS